MYTPKRRSPAQRHMQHTFAFLAPLRLVPLLVAALKESLTYFIMFTSLKVSLAARGSFRRRTAHPTQTNHRGNDQHFPSPLDTARFSHNQPAFHDCSLPAPVTPVLLWRLQPLALPSRRPLHLPSSLPLPPDTKKNNIATAILIHTKKAT